MKSPRMLSIILLISMSCVLIGHRLSAVEPRPVPVVLSTDIGGDVDDVWALSFMLASPELDVKLVVSDGHSTAKKAQLLANCLQRVGRDDIPVGIGVKGAESLTGDEKWIESYRGKVYVDGVQAMIDTIMESARPMVLLAIGPVPNLQLALQREPRIIEHCRLVAMGGCVGRQEAGEPGFVESNIRGDIKAAQAVYSADWDITMAPIDTAGKIQLEGAYYAQVRDADNPMARMVMEHYRIWNDRQKQRKTPHVRDLDRTSSTLWDTVAIYLAFDQSLCLVRDIRLRVTDEAITKPDPNGKLIHVAMEWKDLDAFHKMVADRISGFKP